MTFMGITSVTESSISIICCSFFLWDVENIQLSGRTTLFKISNLVYGGKEVIIRLHSCLEGTERERVAVGYSELAGSLFVTVKISGFGNFLEQAKSYLTAFGLFSFFNVLLTMHVSIILVIDQLNAQEFVH